MRPGFFAWASILVAVTALAGSSSARAATPDFSGCFGGAPEAVVSGAKRLGILQINERYLFWPGYRMDLATRAAGAGIGPGDAKVWDAREAFAVTGVNELVARDLVTGAERTLVDGHDRLRDYLGFSSMGLDDTYVYFASSAQDNDGLFRVRRDGSKPAERIAPSPTKIQTFVAAGGFVYWREDRALLRRKLIADAPEETVVPAGPGRPQGPIRVAGDRMYYMNGRSIWSRAVDGSGAAVEEAAVGSDAIQDLVVVPPCLYFTTSTSIRRARLGGNPRQSQPIADERTFAGNIVSDGRFLYWADVQGGRILRAGPSATTNLPPMPEPVASAARAERTRVPRPQAVIVGDGWGCARVSVKGSVDPMWHCWHAPARAPGTGTPAPIAARRVPWLIENWPAATGDRVCAVVGSEARCWKWSELLRGRPAQVPGRAHVNPPRAAAGGVTTCVSVPTPTETTSRWRCTGDERYGPKAIDTAAGPDAGAVSQIALGRWHGCVSRRGGDTQCWGRGDGGQLGFAPQDRCGPRGHEIACAQEPQAMSFKASWTLLPSDMYTCSMTGGPLTCWGASRDGLFGSADACPPGLVKAWPTLTATVPAPAASCSPTPVNVPGFKHASYDTSVGPRGICATVQGHVRCAGAIRTPSGNVGSPRVSPGDDASACGIADDDVVCWGERYSPGDDPTQPVVIALDTSAAAGLPVIDTPPRPDAPWGDACDVHFGCERAVAPLPACAASKTGRPWSALVADVQTLKSTIISVKGRLFVGRRASRGTTVTEQGAMETPPDSCEPGQCCNSERRPVVVADDGAGAREGLLLGELDCRGDDSRLCCNAPAFGQAVVATGKLVWGYSAWKLDAPALCAVPASARGTPVTRGSTGR